MTMSPLVAAVPKVDLHVHLEGTITPAMVEKLAARNNIDVPAGLLSPDKTGFQWQDDGTAAGSLRAFVQAYDDATAVIKSAEDYIDLTYDYLTRAASENCIYAEITISAEHALAAGLDYPAFLDALDTATNRARADTGIEARYIATCVRHYGPQKALDVGVLTAAHPHPLVTGFGMAGDENAYTVADFKPAYDAAQLENRTAHAGEAAGPESVRAALDILHVRRFGHMVRAAEDADLMRDLVALRAVPEVCVSSNLVLKVFDGYGAHPLRRFFDAGLKVTLGSDDPTFFNTTIGREYQIAHDHFGFTRDELLTLSKNAVEEAFIDAATREKLLQKIAA